MRLLLDEQMALRGRRYVEVLARVLCSQKSRQSPAGRLQGWRSHAL
jgi:hypothetical protein